MRVLVACEFSGTVRRAFEARGHLAYSCDLLPAEDGSKFHFQQDVLEVLDQWPEWDLMIAHPPCTYLTSSAEWAYGDGPYHQKVKPGTLVGEARREARREAVAFVRALLDAPGVRRKAIENPVGHLSRAIGPPDQIIQPFQFGHDARKATCLWLRNLEPLDVPPESEWVKPRMVGGKPRWGNQTDSGQNRLTPSADRWAVRSLTYPGIAAAFAQKWG